MFRVVWPVLLVLLLCSPCFARDDDRTGIAVLGGMGVPAKDLIIANVGLELFLPAWELDDTVFLQPVLGIESNPLYLYSYLGLRLDVVGDQIGLGFTLALGRYDVDEVAAAVFTLGHPLEFRTDIRFFWHLTGGVNLVAGIFHLSNAGIAEENPGIEIFYFGFEYR